MFVERPWVFGVVKSGGPIDLEALTNSQLGDYWQDHGRDAGWHLTSRHGPGRLIRTDLPEDLLFSLVIAIDDTHDKWLLQANAQTFPKMISMQLPLKWLCLLQQLLEPQIRPVTNDEGRKTMVIGHWSFVKENTMIQVENLQYTYTGTAVPAVKNLNFTIEPGEIFGFLGPSGAGKSTTQKILIRLLTGYGGHASVFGKEVSQWGTDYYERVGVSFELPNHFLKLTAVENLTYFGTLYQQTTHTRPRAVTRHGGTG